MVGVSGHPSEQAMRFYIKKEYQMSIASFLNEWGITNSRTRETAKARPKYGVVSSTASSITVRAPSGADAMQLAGMDGRTVAGKKTTCNHKGGGVYEIRAEN
jgi:hypothetical protein